MDALDTFLDSEETWEDYQSASGFLDDDEEEEDFLDWYAEWAGRAGIDPDPDDPRHKYDYRAAYKAGAEPELSPEDNQYHWPSEYKAEDHPSRYVDGIDTITGEPQELEPIYSGLPVVELSKEWHTEIGPLDSFLDSDASWEEFEAAAPEIETTFVERIGKAWETGEAHTSLGGLRYRQLIGEETEEVQRAIDQIKKSLSVDETRGKWRKRTLPERAVSAAAEMLPIQIEGLKKGAKRGLTLGTGAAIITAAAGQVGPQALTPEELITVPVAFAGMYGVGMVSGAIENIGMIEAGLAYDELLELKDSEGRGLDPRIAKGAAAGVGIINGLIEMAQIRLLLKTIPGGEKLLSGAIRSTTKKVIESATLKNLALKYAGNTACLLALRPPRKSPRSLPISCPPSLPNASTTN